MPVGHLPGRRLISSALAAIGCLIFLASSGVAEPRHALAMHGEPLYPAGFDHFLYANPDAPKGGLLTLGLLGTFDSLNPLIVRGTAVQ